MASLPRHVVDSGSLEQAVGALQQRLDELQRMLGQQQRLATMGMITSVIAHEFNNILTPMISYTRYALTDKADETLRTKALEKALAGAERAATISQSLLGFARGDESTVAEVGKVVAETLTCLSRDLSKDGITFTQAVEEGLWAGINAGHLQQVLMNLIVNARAALLQQPRGGGKRMTLKAGRIKRDKVVEIVVQDSGPGIPAEVLPHIFEPFFSTKQREAAAGNGDEALPRGGTGLGLTICQELISAAGGTLRVTSEAGAGCAFIIELPVGEPEGKK